jgi:hypothetical protein
LIPDTEFPALRCVREGVIAEGEAIIAPAYRRD